MTIKIAMFAAALVPIGLTASPVLAQDAAAPASEAIAAEAPAKTFDFDLTLAGVSDYRFRGVSLSDKDPAFQPQVAITHNPSGLYARVWASNIADNGGDSIEIDLVGGISREIGGFTFDVGATYYAYPGAKANEYVELIGVVSHDIGPASVGVTFAYSPKQSAIGNVDGKYAAINASLPIKGTPLTLAGSFGFEDNGFYDNKKDWTLGVTADVLGFTIGAAYVDTSHTSGDPLGDPGAIISISRTF
jgi:uncharacterized protein (TIGR02001 family)